MKMLIFDFRDSEKQFFKENVFTDFDIDFFKYPLNDKTELDDEIKDDTSVISVFRTSNLSKEVLSKFKNLRIVSTRSYGYNHIDLEYCQSHNIAVLNVEQYGEEAVAQYAFALIIALIRNLMPAISDIKMRRINYEKIEGRLLKNLKLGIIGCGITGTAVAKIAHFFGMEILIYSYMQNPELNNYCRFVTKDELLSEADVISLHLIYTGDNYHILSAEDFDKMKDGVYVVNTARGELLDIRALYNNLLSGKVRGAALDVMECEILNTDRPEEAYNNTVSHCAEAAEITKKLFNLDNVIITPHLAYNTKESVNYLLEKTFNNIRDYLKGMYINRVC